jgi:hypothetical protein
MVTLGTVEQGGLRNDKCRGHKPLSARSTLKRLGSRILNDVVFAGEGDLSRWTDLSSLASIGAVI